MKKFGTSLTVQWLRLRASTAGGVGLILVGELCSRIPRGTAKKIKINKKIWKNYKTSVIEAILSCHCLSSHLSAALSSQEAFIYLFFINVFILFMAALGLRCCTRAFLWWRQAGATLRWGTRVSHCSGFSGARALGAWASVVVAHGLSSCGLRALEHRLSSCGARA